MDGCDGAGDGDELVVAGDGMIADRRCAPRARSTPDRSATTSASASGGTSAADAEAGAQRRVAARSRSTSAASPGARPALEQPTGGRHQLGAGDLDGLRLPDRPTQADRRARARRRRRPAPSWSARPAHAVRDEVVRASCHRRRPGWARRRTARSSRLAGRAGRRRAPRCRPRPSRSLVAKAAPPTATTSPSPLGRDHDEGEVAAAQARRAGQAGVVADGGATVDRLDAVEGRDRADAAVERPPGRARRPGGRRRDERRARVGDDQGAALRAPRRAPRRSAPRRGGRRAAARRRRPSSGSPTESSTSAPEALEERHEGAGARGDRRSAGRAGARRSGRRRAGRRRAAPRRRTPPPPRPAERPLSATRDAPGPGVELGEASRLGGAGGGAAVPGRLEELGGGRQRRGGVRAGVTATSRTYSPAVRPGLLGDGAPPHEVGHQRPVAAPQPLGPATLRLEALGLGPPLRGGRASAPPSPRARPADASAGSGDPAVADEQVHDAAERAGHDDPGQHRAPASAHQGPERLRELVADPPHAPGRGSTPAAGRSGPRRGSGPRGRGPRRGRASDGGRPIRWPRGTPRWRRARGRAPRCAPAGRGRSSTVMPATTGIVISCVRIVDRRGQHPADAVGAEAQTTSSVGSSPIAVSKRSSTRTLSRANAEHHPEATAHQAGRAAHRRDRARAPPRRSPGR